MPDEQFSPDDDQLGPMDYVAVEFPGGRITGDGFGILLDLVDRGFVRILDLEFVTRTPEGDIEIIDVPALDTEPGLDLTPFAGVSSGILDRADLDEVGGNISPGSVAAALIYEELVVLPVLAAWQRSGARIVTEGHISPEEILLALDATEPA
ncbi:DUF6325 family protein [Nakamurella sp. GG22]